MAAHRARADAGSVGITDGACGETRQRFPTREGGIEGRALPAAADLCAVKKHILNPPAFEIRTV
jgi:hypothetical protein